MSSHRSQRQFSPVLLFLTRGAPTRSFLPGFLFVYWVRLIELLPRTWTSTDFLRARSASTGDQQPVPPPSHPRRGAMTGFLR